MDFHVFQKFVGKSEKNTCAEVQSSGWKRPGTKRSVANIAIQSVGCTRPQSVTFPSLSRIGNTFELRSSGVAKHVRFRLICRNPHKTYAIHDSTPSAAREAIFETLSGRPEECFQAC